MTLCLYDKHEKVLRSIIQRTHIIGIENGFIHSLITKWPLNVYLPACQANKEGIGNLTYSIMNISLNLNLQSRRGPQTKTT